MVACDTDAEPPDLAEKYAETVFGRLLREWKNAPLGEQEYYSASIENMFAESMEDTVYGQDMRKLDLADSDGVVLVEDCAGAGPQYFYADGSYTNGLQVWRKAFNPFVWCGARS